jgi:Tol biopolymer transport system component
VLVERAMHTSSRWLLLLAAAAPAASLALRSPAAAAAPFPEGRPLEVVAGCGTCTDPGREPALSADGRFIAFVTSERLVADDTDDRVDAYVFDRQEARYERISAAIGGAAADRDSAGVSISGDGRYVAFSSAASNLVADDHSGAPDVFVRDRDTQTTIRASVASDGGDADWSAMSPKLSADGRHVAFASRASNLVAGDTNKMVDVFVRDLDLARTERINLTSTGGEANGHASGELAISADGQVVAFMSSATNLVAADGNKVDDVFVRDRAAGTTTRVSVTSAGIEADAESGMPSLSSDGRFVAFISRAKNLATGRFTFRRAFRHDRQSGTTALVKVALPDAAIDDTRPVSLSADGRYAAVTASYYPSRGYDTYEVFVVDMDHGTVRIASSTAGGKAGKSVSVYGAISASGGYLVFLSRSTDLTGRPASDWAYVVVKNAR